MMWGSEEEENDRQDLNTEYEYIYIVYTDMHTYTNTYIYGKYT